ncbi:unnamed protein product [Effrenium voratum]|uniref:HTH cro/C1-type domain-containing protein n=1 Tax=Effrenium voratum TaxID=2562239 RepID=A0AA36IPY2_9DINO|nr:unnamed protein product [Effrenium voratum]
MGKLQELREAAGLTQAQLAKAAGTSQPQIFRLEKSKRTLSKDWAERLAPALRTSPAALMFDQAAATGLPIVGVAQAGAFREVAVFDYDEDDRPMIALARDFRFPDASQYALQVAGESMNRRYPNGTFVSCVAWADTGRMDPVPGMCLHVERHQGPLVEVTLKLYAERDGKRWLEPDSTDGRFKPIEINGDDGTEIVVKGLVTGSWRPETFD